MALDWRKKALSCRIQRKRRPSSLGIKITDKIEDKMAMAVVMAMAMIAIYSKNDAMIMMAQKTNHNQKTTTASDDKKRTKNEEKDAVDQMERIEWKGAWEGLNSEEQTGE